MEHEITISYGPTTGQELDDETAVMAEINLRSFEEDGYPDPVKGKLLEVPEGLLHRVQSGRSVYVNLGGKPYTFSSLGADGEFELRRDYAAEGAALRSAS